MNKKPHLYLLLPLLALVVLVGGWNIMKPKTCVSDGAHVCFDKTTGFFAIEEGAILIVEVPTQTYGEELLKLFTSVHPDRKDVLSFKLSSQTSDKIPDLSYLSQSEAALKFKSLVQIDETLAKSWIDNLQWDKASELNKDGLRFIPMSGKGFTFIYDATVLTRLGVNLIDSDLDGLPDAIDTMEEVGAIARKYLAEDGKRSLLSVFPLQFNEILSFYPLLTLSGWQMFPDDTATNPGFDASDFLKSLQAIATLGSLEIVKTAQTDPAKLVWQYDQVLEGKEFLFSMASEWMFTEAFEKRTKHDIRNVRFPSLSNVVPTPLIDVSGYVVNSSKYPSAITEVLRLIRSNEGLKIFSNSTQESLLAHPSIIGSLEIADQKKRDLALAYVHSTSVPLIALEGNPSVLGFSMYREIELLPTMRKVFLGEISAEQAQTEIVGRAEAWIEANHGYPAEEVKK
jgi:arabinogalactan oligomer/maltooligosaccharide transport system substrate-binding protein